MTARRIIIGCALLALIAVGAGLWGNALLHRPRPVPPTTVVIPAGASGQQAIRRLAQAGVIDHPRLLRLYGRLTRQSGRIQSGWYHFSGGVTPVDALHTLVAGKVMQFQVTVPEGLRSSEILALLAKATGIPLPRWQQAWHALHGKEGILLPDSWRYTRPLQPRALLTRMIRAQQQLLATLEPDRSRWQRLRIIASIIEKETALPEERPIISAVIRNRLQRHMPLQMDPTIIYGLYQIDGRFSGDITRRDLKRDTPWNSYLHKGLPPTPICHPGRGSLIAAAHPAASHALYFVANGKGGHNFAQTLAEHQQNVAAFLHGQKR